MWTHRRPRDGPCGSLRSSPVCHFYLLRASLIVKVASGCRKLSGSRKSELRVARVNARHFRKNWSFSGPLDTALAYKCQYFQGETSAVARHRYCAIEANKIELSGRKGYTAECRSVGDYITEKISRSRSIYAITGEHTLLPESAWSFQLHKLMIFLAQSPSARPRGTEC